jgi:putative aldouronate transport system permease protein
MHAYVLAQKNFKLQRFLIWMLFFTMLFGGGLVPGYILNVRYLHINNTFWIFILPGLANAWSIIILRTFIKTTVPDSLIESAKIDGAGHFRIYVTIVIPLLKAGIATIALFGFIGRWNDWFTALLYNDKPSLTPLQTMLYRLQASVEFIKQNSAIASTPEGISYLRNLPSDNLRMAITVMVILPITFAYPFFQRYFIHGMLVGSIKE